MLKLLITPIFDNNDILEDDFFEICIGSSSRCTDIRVGAAACQHFQGDNDSPILTAVLLQSICNFQKRLINRSEASRWKKIIPRTASSQRDGLNSKL